MKPEDIVEAAYSSLDDTDPLLLATLRAGIVGAWSEKTGVTALLRSALQGVMIERPTSVVPYLIDFFEKMQPKKIVIFGPPASGKRTLGEFLSRRLGLEYVSIRDITEGVSNIDSAIGRELRECVEKGVEPRWELLEALVIGRLEEKDCLEKGWILEGWPQSPEQVKRLREKAMLPTIGIVLEVPDVIIEDRVSFRQYHPDTAKVYHMLTDPPPLGVGCKCITRKGESTQEILARLASYHAMLGPVLQELRNIPGFMEIKADVQVPLSQLETVGEDVARKIDKASI